MYDKPFKKIIAFALALSCTVSALGFTGINEISAHGEDSYNYNYSTDLSDSNAFDIFINEYDYDYDYFYYDGKEKKPSITVFSNDEWDYLVENIDYKVTYLNNTNAGTATVVVEGIGSYTGKQTLTFDIEKADLNDYFVDAEFEAGTDTFPYTGLNIKPKVKVTVNNNVLTENKDYTVQYENSCSAVNNEYNWFEDSFPEPYTVKITGKDNCTGECTLYYYISAASLSKAEVTFPKTYTYTGSEIKPEPIVKYNGTTLKKGKDYVIDSYSNNTNAGQGKITISGNGGYCDSKTVPFSIQKKKINNLTVNSISAQAYTGKAVCPKPKVYGDGKLLTNGKDYTLTYSNNVKTGTAKCTVTPKGNYTGTPKTVNFKIQFGIISSLKSVSSSSSIKLSWSKTPLASGYKIYKYDYKKKKWGVIKKVTGTSYSIKKLSCASSYKFAVVAYRKLSNGKYEYGPKITKDCVTKPVTPTVTIKAYKNKANISWTRNSRSQGYEIYWCKGDGSDINSNSTCWNEMVLLKTVNAKTGSYTKTKLSSSKNYHFRVRAYRIINGKKVYSNWSSLKCTADSVSRLNAAKRYSHSTYKIINTQGKTDSVSYHTLTAEEKRILSNFAKKHFKKNWSAGQKVVYTAEWIRNNMTYGHIPTASHTENIFVHKEGQCSDYNGALVEMMTYLGFSPQLIQGNRYSSLGQHFWGEISIDGITYLLEVGEKVYDSPQWGYKWEFICYKYSEKQEGGKYLKHLNGKWQLL